MTRTRPRRPYDFEVAIICALTIEADAVEALFDEHWDDLGADSSFKKLSVDWMRSDFERPYLPGAVRWIESLHPGMAERR